MKKNIWICVSIVLAVITVGIIIISIFNHMELQKYKEAYTLNDQELVCNIHEQTIDDLSSQLSSAQNELKSAQANKIDTVINDITYMLETFYTIDDAHPSGDRYAKLKDYVTKEYEFYISNLTSVSSEYRQSIDIQDTFYSKLTDTEARVLVFCTVSMESEKWGSVTQPNVYEIEAQYNSELQKWQVAGIKVGEGISLQDFKTA